MLMRCVGPAGTYLLNYIFLVLLFIMFISKFILVIKLSRYIRQSIIN